MLKRRVGSSRTGSMWPVVKQSNGSWEVFWIPDWLQCSKKYHATRNYFQNVLTKHYQSMQQQSFKNTYINLECSWCRKCGGHRKIIYYLRRCYSNRWKIESNTSVTSNETIILWFYCVLCIEEAFYILTHVPYLDWIWYKKSTIKCFGATALGLLSRTFN
jgi:hypothetical protein